MQGLTSKELATTLAALRYWRQEIEKNTSLNLSRGANRNDFGPYFDDYPPLATWEIDRLVDKLNAPEPYLFIGLLTDRHINVKPDPADDGPEVTICKELRHGLVSREGAVAFMRDILRFRRMA